MANDQVKYSDLILPDDSFEKLKKELEAVKQQISDIKTEASGLASTLKNVSTATRDQQQATAANAAAMETLSRKTKALNDEKDRLEAATRRYNNLTDEEARHLKKLNDWLSLGALWQEAAAKHIDTTNMSYNEMKATMNALIATLRTFDTEQKKNSTTAMTLETAVENLRNAMKDLDNNTKAAANAEKQLEQEAKQAAKEAAAAAKEQEKVAKEEAKHQKEVQKNTEAIRQNYEAEKKRLKLTDEEYESVSKLRVALQGSAQDQIDAVQAIDIQAKSYNELYQTYNAIKDVLNGMTTAERENTEAGKAMVDQAKNIRDTLNNLQQATGNYALNVGNYASAMNGLKFQVQQIFREIPSAINIQQFFLAISNNLPMFTDALSRWNKELPGIRTKLASVTAEIEKQKGFLSTLVEGTDAYAVKQEEIKRLQEQQNELQKLNVSGWRAVWKSVKSWQTLLVAGIFAMRKWLAPLIEKIVEKWKEWRHGVQLVSNEMNTMTARAQVYSDVLKKTNDEIVKLDMVVERIKTIDKGTQEWKDAVAMVNDITKQNLDAVKTTKEEIEKVTEAYKEQAIQIATNDIIAEKIAKSRAQKALVKAAMEADTLEAAMDLAGLKPDSKEGKKFIQAWSDYNVTRNVKNYKPNNDWMKLPEIESDLQVPDTPVHIEPLELGDKERIKVENIVRSQFQDMIDEDSEKILQQMIKPVKPLKKEKTPKATGAGISYNDNFTGVTMADIALAEANAMQDKGENALQTIELWYAKKSAIARASYDKDIETLNQEEKRKNEQLTESVLNAQVFVSKYNDTLDKLNAQHAAGALDDDEWAAQKERLAHQHTEATNIIKNQAIEQQRLDQYYGQQRKVAEQKRNNELLDLQAEYNKKKNEEQEKDDKKDAKDKLKREADNWQTLKTQLIEQGKTRKQIVEAEVAAEIARLNLMLKLNRDINGEKMSDEQRQKVEEWINLLERLQQTGNYGDYKPGQFMGKGGANVTNERKNYANIWEVLGIDMDNNQVSTLNSVFDQAKEALNGWMDARKAAAEQAKELADDEVSAAENALNREIELRNQGYANDVALRERELADAKKRQKEAADMQKKAEKDALAVNSAMEASSMAVAIANLFKDFPLYAAIPLTAVLLGSFATAKVQSFQAIKSTKYKEGGVMLLEGGSHESGHDVNLGIGPDGSNLRAEGGEYFAVINKRNSRKYGSEIPGIVNALNGGVFEDRYIKTRDAMGLAAMAGAASGYGNVVDLSAVESGVGELVKQGERSWSTEGEYRVMRYKNLTRRVRISG